MYHRKELASMRYPWAQRVLFDNEQESFLTTLSNDSGISVSNLIRILVAKEMAKYNTSTIYIPKKIPKQTMVSKTYE